MKTSACFFGLALALLGCGLPVESPAEESGTDSAALSEFGYPPAKWVASPNFFSRGGTPVDTLVILTAESTYKGAITVYQNPNVGAATHYVVSSVKGEITQMVREEDAAIFASCWNKRSIGIALEGRFADTQPFREAQYVATAQLTAYLVKKWGIPLDRNHVKGLSDLGGCINKLGPGAQWDWNHFMGLVAAAQAGTLDAGTQVVPVPDAGAVDAGATNTVDAGTVPQVDAGTEQKQPQPGTTLDGGVVGVDSERTDAKGCASTGAGIEAVALLAATVLVRKRPKVPGAEQGSAR